MNPYTTVKYTKTTTNNFMRPLDIYCSICACAGELVYFPPLYGWFRCHFLCEFVAVAAVAVSFEPVLGAPWADVNPLQKKRRESRPKPETEADKAAFSIFFLTHSKLFTKPETIFV